MKFAMYELHADQCAKNGNTREGSFFTGMIAVRLRAEIIKIHAAERKEQTYRAQVLRADSTNDPNLPDFLYSTTLTGRALYGIFVLRPT